MSKFKQFHTACLLQNVNVSYMNLHIFHLEVKGSINPNQTCDICKTPAW
jgi:hypothetical protein